MKKMTYCGLIPFLVLGLFMFILLMPGLSFPGTSQATCNDSATRGYLNVLTINLLFSELEDRQTRLETIADFIAQHSDPVDVVLLQEVVGGSISGTVNSSFDLKNLLAAKGLNYNLSYRVATKLSGILSVGNGILSRCEISYTLSKSLPSVIEGPFYGIEIPLRRKAMMSRINVPDFGEINVYNTHLCAYCIPLDRLEQAEALMDFVDHVESRISSDNPIILGGDFNTDLNIPDDLSVYQLVTQYGFIDTYAAYQGCSSCCSSSTDMGCTYAVQGNPYAGASEKAARIDYIFIKGEKFGIGGSTVVFNSAPWVSDHSGVLTQVNFK